MDGYLPSLKIADGSLVPLIWLVGAAFLLWGVRRLFNITRWHGPADSIFGAHRLDNEIDVKAGIGSTLAAFISLEVVPLLASTVPWCISEPLLERIFVKFLAIKRLVLMCLLVVV